MHRVGLGWAEHRTLPYDLRRLAAAMGSSPHGAVDCDLGYDPHGQAVRSARPSTSGTHPRPVTHCLEGEPP